MPPARGAEREAGVWSSCSFSHRVFLPGAPRRRRVRLSSRLPLSPPPSPAACLLKNLREGPRRAARGRVQQGASIAAASPAAPLSTLGGSPSSLALGGHRPRLLLPPWRHLTVQSPALSSSAQPSPGLPEPLSCRPVVVLLLGTHCVPRASSLSACSLAQSDDH